MDRNPKDTTRLTRDPADDPGRDRNPKDDQPVSREKPGDTGIPADAPRQPISDERQFMPDAGEVPPPPGEDIMDEARDGFLDRYPPKGQNNR